MISQSLQNELNQRGIVKLVAVVATQVLVDKDDAGFKNPTKGIGGFTNEEEIREFEKDGWRVNEDAGLGWRRVIASPTPLEIIELGALSVRLWIRALSWSQLVGAALWWSKTKQETWLGFALWLIRIAPPAYWPKN